MDTIKTPKTTQTAQPSQPQKGGRSGKQRFKPGFLAGLVAGVAASAVMLLVSVAFGGISLPEELGSEITALMPPGMFAYLHQIIGGDAKVYLFYIILLGQCLVFALSGGLYNLVVRSRFLTARGKASTRTQLDWLDGVVLAFILWLLTGLLFLPATGAGIFGVHTSIGLASTMLSLAVVGLVFGLVFVSMQNWLASGIFSKRTGENAISRVDENESNEPGIGI